MRFKSALFICIALTGFFLILTLFVHFVNKDKSKYFHEKGYNEDLLNIIKLQNHTIHALESLLRESKTGNLVESSKYRIEDSSFYSPPFTNAQIDCENRYGMSLLKQWKESREVWCESSASDSLKSSLVCYPYHQQHKIADGRGKDMFCVANNFVIDFSKIEGTASDIKEIVGNQYLNFLSGSLLSNCKKTEKFIDNLFMPHHLQQMRTFQSNVPISELKESRLVSIPTYLLARDEDCENMFHSTADFMNMFLVLSVLNISPQELQVMLFDKHPDGPYVDLIKNAFSRSNDLIRYSFYSGEKIRFKQLVFHLESPAALIFPKVANPDPIKCFSSSFFNEYRKFILQSFNLWDISPPRIPSVALSVRRRTSQKNVGRIMQNEDEIVNIIKGSTLVNFNVIDGAEVSFSDHIKMIRNSNILVGVHGAGLMMILFAADESILIEIHPSYRQDRHFRHATRMVGKIYLPIRSKSRETCLGTSDNVIVPIDEFKRVFDSAVHIARSFNSGIAECGINCPSGILALDKKLDGLYDLHESDRINTNFPCM